MIEHKEVAGRPATVVYLDVNFDPVDDKKQAKLVKVVFDDGSGSMFLSVPGSQIPVDDPQKADKAKILAAQNGR